MSDELIVKKCSPTLAGIKTGNMFSIRITDGEDIYSELRDLNRVLLSKGIRVIPLKITDGFALIYLYRHKYLKKDLKDSKAVKILKKRGYHLESPERCIVQLVSRLKEKEDFPHEIGLFLGYPPSDVEGFIKHPRTGVKCSGCWKAFSKPDEARKTFNRFTLCTKEYQEMNRNGKTLTQLAVKVG